MNKKKNLLMMLVVTVMLGTACGKQEIKNENAQVKNDVQSIVSVAPKKEDIKEIKEVVKKSTQQEKMQVVVTPIKVNVKTLSAPSKPIAVQRLTTKIVYNNLVKSNPVYATLKSTGEKVELLEDRGNGVKYNIRKKNGSTVWVNGSSVDIPRNPVTNRNYMNTVQLESYVNNTSNFVSKSNQLIWVDLERQKTNIFKGSAGKWKLQKSVSVATGNNVTPTKRGIFTVQDRGYQFSAGPGLVARYFTRFDGNYLFHTIILNTSGSISDGTLGQRASHGCIRMPISEAKAIYDSMPRGTLVWVN